MEKSGDQGDSGATRNHSDVVLVLADRLAAALGSEMPAELSGRVADDQWEPGATRDGNSPSFALAARLAAALGPQMVAELSRRIADGHSDRIADRAVVDWALGACVEALASAADRDGWPEIVDREGQCAR